MSTPDRYAVVGHPIGHSLSPRIHALFARQTHQSISYEALDVPPAQLSAALHTFFSNGGCGLNVTIPHKQAVLALMNSLTERAGRAAAVNTVVREAAGLRGDNTDGVGLLRDLTQRLGIVVRARRVLLLGAGGAARGVLGPLLAERPDELVVANRNLERARALAGEYAAQAPVRAAPLGELDGPYDLIVNATGASLTGQMPALSPALLGSGTVCYDLGYAELDTPFVRWAHRLGAQQAHMGLGMLVEQAAESFWLWRGVRPDTDAVLAALRAGK